MLSYEVNRVAKNCFKLFMKSGEFVNVWMLHLYHDVDIAALMLLIAGN